MCLSGSNADTVYVSLSTVPLAVQGHRPISTQQFQAGEYCEDTGLGLVHTLHPGAGSRAATFNYLMGAWGIGDYTKGK